jgi:hypothetical protein
MFRAMLCQFEMLLKINRRKNIPDNPNFALHLNLSLHNPGPGANIDQHLSNIWPNLVKCSMHLKWFLALDTLTNPESTRTSRRPIHNSKIASLEPLPSEDLFFGFDIHVTLVLLLQFPPPASRKE